MWCSAPRYHAVLIMACCPAIRVQLLAQHICALLHTRAGLESQNRCSLPTGWGQKDHDKLLAQLYKQLGQLLNQAGHEIAGHAAVVIEMAVSAFKRLKAAACQASSTGVAGGACTRTVASTFVAAHWRQSIKLAFMSTIMHRFCNSWAICSLPTCKLAPARVEICQLTA